MIHQIAKTYPQGMGQPVSRRYPTTSPFPAGAAPFENYQVYTGPQGPPADYIPGYPPPGPRRPRDGPLPRRRMLEEDAGWGGMDYDDPVYLPDAVGPRRRPGGFDPFDDPRRDYPPPSSVTRDRGGVAQEMIAAMRDDLPGGRPFQGRGFNPRFRSAPPQPRVTRGTTTVVNEPPGFMPGQQFAYGPQQIPGAPQPQQQVIYYDPATGACSGGGQVPGYTPQAQTAPQMYMMPGMMQQGMMPQMMGMQGMPQTMGMMGMPQMGMGMFMPQEQPKPIVIPGQLYTAAGGVQQLG